MAESGREIVKRSAAKWDLIEITVSIGRKNPTAISRFLEAAEAAFERLAEWPEMGSAQELHTSRLNLRKWPVPGFPSYLIFYIPTDSGIIIERVVHGARDLAPLLEEIED
jgi:toxin ParE1/3/4